MIFVSLSVIMYLLMLTHSHMRGDEPLYATSFYLYQQPKIPLTAHPCRLHTGFDDIEPHLVIAADDYRTGNAGLDQGMMRAPCPGQRKAIRFENFNQGFIVNRLEFGHGWRPSREVARQP